MDLFSALRVFVRVADLEGFSKASRDLGMATSSVTRQVDALEEHLGVRLFNRSTREVNLTPAGETYYTHATQLIEAALEAERCVSEAGGVPKGVLRVTAPVAFARLHIAPTLSSFIRDYPDVQLVLDATDSIVNLVEDRIDIAIRMGDLASSSLIARKFAPHRRVVCASPDYLGEHGEPATPQDLAQHRCLDFDFSDGVTDWLFRRGDETLSLPISGPVRANNSEVLREAAISGAGLIMMPTWLVGEDVEVGRLRRVLPDWECGHGSTESTIQAVYLPNRRGSPKVRAFIDHLAQSFGSPPYWDRT
ncbi:MAG: LysR family transcriptional regulator [Pseudomonadota bacterium]